MAPCLRSGKEQAASDALSASLLIAGGAGLATLLILEVPALLRSHLLVHMLMLGPCHEHNFSMTLISEEAAHGSLLGEKV